RRQLGRTLAAQRARSSHASRLTGAPHPSSLAFCQTFFAFFPQRGDTAMGEGSPKTEMINPALLDGVSANFIVKGPSGVEKAYPMRTLVVTIGRSDQCEIAVKDGSMSGKHAEVSKINGEIKVKD